MNEPVPPRTSTEQLVAAVWRELLHLETLSVTDNFFEVGGHSLLAVQAVHEIAVRAGVELELEVFFDLDTLEQIAAEIDRRRALPQGEDGYEGDL